MVGYRFGQYYGPYRSIYYRYIIGISRNGICLNMFHKSKNFARILVYKIWKCHFKKQYFKCLLQKQKKYSFFSIKLHFIKFTIYRYRHRYRPIWQLLYRYHNRYRPIWKSEISVVIGIGRYEKMLIGRPLVLCTIANASKNIRNFRFSYNYKHVIIFQRAYYEIEPSQFSTLFLSILW